MEEFFAQVWQIIVTLADPRNLRNPDTFKAALNQPGVFWAAFFAVNAIVFTETGLLIGFLLPGDSLLVVLGVVAYLSGWNLPLLMGSLCVGDPRRYRRLLDRLEGGAGDFPSAIEPVLQAGISQPCARLLRKARRQNDHHRPLRADRTDIRARRCGCRENAISLVPVLQRHWRN